MGTNKRADHVGTERQLYAKNRQRILATQTVCGICGQPVDKRLKYPDPMSATVDHIIPVNKGGGSDIDNLQLAHFWCNRQKSDKLIRKDRDAAHKNAQKAKEKTVHWSRDWITFKPEKA